MELSRHFFQPLPRAASSPTVSMFAIVASRHSSITIAMHSAPFAAVERRRGSGRKSRRQREGVQSEKEGDI